MKRALLVLLAVVVLVVGVAVGGAWWFLSRLDVRAEIERRVEAATGREFKVKGVVGVTFSRRWSPGGRTGWPSVGLKGADVSLANAPAGTAEQMFTANEIVLVASLKPLLRGHVEVSEFVIVAPRVALEVDGEGHPNWMLRPTVATHLSTCRADGAPDKRVQAFSLHGLSVVDGSVSYTNFTTGSSYEVRDVDLIADLDGMDAPLTVGGSASWRDRRATIDLTLGRFCAVLDRKTTPLRASLAVALLDANATLDGAVDFETGDLSAELTTSGPDLRALAAWAGAPLSGSQGLEAFAVSGHLDVGAEGYAFKNAAIKIDRVTAHGELFIKQGLHVPHLSGRLDIGALDLTHYLAQPPSEGGVQVAPVQKRSSEAPTWGELPISFAGLKTIDTNLELTTGSLQISRTKLDSTRSSLMLSDGYLVATLKELRMYGGHGTGRFTIDARARDLDFQNELSIRNVNAQAFFSEVFGSNYVRGNAAITLDLSAQGATERALVASLSGTASIRVADGEIHGIRLRGAWRNLQYALLVVCSLALHAPDSRTSQPR